MARSDLAERLKEVEQTFGQLRAVWSELDRHLQLLLDQQAAAGCAASDSCQATLQRLHQQLEATGAEQVRLRQHLEQAQAEMSRIAHQLDVLAELPPDGGSTLADVIEPAPTDERADRAAPPDEFDPVLQRVMDQMAELDNQLQEQ